MRLLGVVRIGDDAHSFVVLANRFVVIPDLLHNEQIILRLRSTCHSHGCLFCISEDCSASATLSVPSSSGVFSRTASRFLFLKYTQEQGTGNSAKVHKEPLSPPYLFGLFLSMGSTESRTVTQGVPPPGRINEREVM